MTHCPLTVTFYFTVSLHHESSVVQDGGNSTGKIGDTMKVQKLHCSDSSSSCLQAYCGESEQMLLQR